MNNCVKLILILIVILVLFTFATGANKGTEHFDRECDKPYNSQQIPRTSQTCPRRCSNTKVIITNESGKDKKNFYCVNS